MLVPSIHVGKFPYPVFLFRKSGVRKQQVQYIMEVEYTSGFDSTLYLGKLRFMKEFEYCVYWMEEGEPACEVFGSLPEAEMFSCMIRGRQGIEYVEVMEEAVEEPEREECFHTGDSIL